MKCIGLVDTRIDHPYLVVGAIKSNRNVTIEVVGSVENIDSKPTREFEVICNLYVNRFHWFYIVDGKSGVIRYSHGMSHALNYVFSN